MPDTYTQRGFAVYAALDLPDDGYRGERFTVQESSLATERKVWVGVDDARAHLSVDEARRVRDALSEFIEAAPEAVS